MTTESPARPGRIDTGALRRRYAEERDKRLRPDGNDQYLRLTGDFAHYLDDPYTPWTERAPRTDHRTVVCVGGGFAGLVTGARLREAGVDVRIIEKGGDFGGTWYWNRYPGAQCDTASMVYMPLLEETGHMPTEKYVRGPEILAHCRRIGRQFGLYDDMLFHTEVTGLTWDEARTRWVIQTSRGDRLTAMFVVLGTGPLSVPKLPGIPGIGSFRGHSFHTSRWDYDYTGGVPETPRTPGARRCASSPVKAWASSVPGRPRSSACRIFPGTLGNCTCSSARRPRSTCGTITRSIRTGSPRSPRRAGSGAGSRTSPPTRPAGPRTRTSCRTAGPTSPAGSGSGSPCCRRRTSARLRCWPPTRSPTSRRWRRSAPAPTPSCATRAPAHPQGLVPPTVQAAVLPRRVPAGLQQPEYAPGRHGRQGRRADYRHRRGRRRPGIRARLHHLRLRLRSRHPVHPAGRLRGDRRAGTPSEYWADGMRTLHGIHARGFPNLLLVRVDAGREPDL